MRAQRRRRHASHLPRRTSPPQVAWAHDGETLYTGSRDRAVHAFDVSALAAGGEARGAALIASYVGHLGAVTAVAASPAAHVLASASADRTVRLWDARAHQQLHAFETHDSDVAAVAWSPSGARIASVSASGALAVASVGSFTAA